METELALVLFVGLVALVLTWNLGLLWSIRRSLGQVASRFQTVGSKLEQTFRVSNGTMQEKAGAWANLLVDLSSHAVTLSDRLKNTVARLPAVLDSAQTQVQFSLAKIDAQMDRVSQDISGNADKIKSAALEPLLRAGSVASGILKVLKSFVPDGSREIHDQR